MNLENIFISISGILIVMLLGIIGFFLKRQITVIESLTESVNALKISQEIGRANDNNIRVNCMDRHNIINKRLDNCEDFVLFCNDTVKPNIRRQQKITKLKNDTQVQPQMGQ